MFGAIDKSTHPSLLRRRLEDDNRQRLQNIVKDDFIRTQRAEWEQKAEDVNQNSQMKGVIQSFQESEQATLAQRRQRLTQLLAEEDAMYRQEIESMRETPQQQRERIVARAKAAKQQREIRRKQFVEQQQYLQWRSGCDDLRAIDSHKKLEMVYQERNLQLQQMKAKEAQNLADKRQFQLQFTAEVQQQDAKAKEEEKKQKQLVFNAKQMLQQQITELEQQRERERVEREALKAKYRQQTQEENEQGRMQAELLAQQNRAKNAEMKAFNDELQRLKREQKELERQRDVAALQQVLEAHKDETEQQMQEKMRLRRDMHAFREYLVERKTKEAEMEREIERLTQAEWNKVQERYDSVKQKEEQARQKLMQEVYQIRYQQCLDRENHRSRSIEEKRRELDELQKDMARWKEQETNQQAKKLAEATELASLFRQQAATARQSKRVDRSSENATIRNEANMAEQQYKQWLQREAQAPSAPSTFARKATVWD